MKFISDASCEIIMEDMFTRLVLLYDILLNRAGDTVYVLRDIIEETAPKTSPPAKHTYKTIKNFSYADLDIFRIERLWKDEK
jgi:histone-lysine N-methyltransferase ASH1L